jgi:hypothetical protein
MTQWPLPAGGFGEPYATNWAAVGVTDQHFPGAEDDPVPEEAPEPEPDPDPPLAPAPPLLPDDPAPTLQPCCEDEHEVQTPPFPPARAYCVLSASAPAVPAATTRELRMRPVRV